MPEENPTEGSINSADRLDEVMTEFGLNDCNTNREGIALLLETIAAEEDPEARLIEVIEEIREIPEETDRMIRLIDIVHECEKKAIALEPAEDQGWLMENILSSNEFTKTEIRSGMNPEEILAVPTDHLPKWYLDDAVIRNQLNKIRSNSPEENTSGLGTS